MKRFLLFIISLFVLTSCGENRNKESHKEKNIDTPDTLVLKQDMTTHTKRLHMSHSSHASHRSHFSQM